MTITVRRFLVGFLLTFPGWAGQLPACQSTAKEDKDSRKVRVSVVVILASEKEDRVDRKLEGIAREVRRMHPKLKGFRMASLACKSVPVGAADRFDLVDDEVVKVTVQRAADGMDRIRLKVAPPSMGEITYSTPCGKFLPIVTPLRTRGNELILIAIRVQPCNSGK